jgi:ABC-type uncharacterized transport system permease subunit
MKLRLKEDPKEWRKAAWLSAGGLAALSSVLRWRRILPNPPWMAVLALAGMIAVGACLAPRWFRGYYRFSHRLGFHLARALGFIVLGVFFILVITPLGLALRALGQDPLRLKRTGKEESYWNTARPNSPLDRLF